MISKVRNPDAGAESPALPSGGAARHCRAEARERLSRARRREELYGESFDILRGADVFRLLIGLGAGEVAVAAEIGAAVAPTPLTSFGAALAGSMLAGLMAAGQIGVGMSLWLLLKVFSCFRKRFRRPIYYPKERLRRQALAKDRRRVRDRFTPNPCPEPCQLLEQYAKARTSAREAIRFGSMLCDLEAYCDNSLVRNADGEIVGRNPGVRGWLRTHCPELASHYSNAMRYKALAEKFRQACGAWDPVPAEALASEDDGDVRKLAGRKVTVRICKANGDRKGKTVAEEFDLDAGAVEQAWRQAQRLLAECEGVTSEAGSANGTRCGKISTGIADGGAGSPNEEGTGLGDSMQKQKQNTEATRKCDCNGIRCGKITALAAAIDERLAPEFAPSGWKFDNNAPPSNRPKNLRSASSALA